MGDYRKKPVVIQAERFQTEADIDRLTRWVIAGGGNAVPKYLGSERQFDGLLVLTLEGTMRAEIGDYIIRGVKGEFYPCKPDIFAATYEPVSPTPAEEGDR